MLGQSTVSKEVRAKAIAALKDQGMTLNEYLRNAITHVAEGNPMPFERRAECIVKMGRPKRASKQTE